MRIRARTRYLVKGGNAPDEYEDAFWPVDGEFDLPTYRCAIADGATETSFSAMWSRLVVRAYARGQFEPRRFTRSLTALQQQWRLEVGARPLPWYAEEKLSYGAFCAFLGLTIRQQDGGLVWQALAVGDCCLFQVRGGDLVASFPFDDPAAFGSRPHLLPSRPGRTADLSDHLIRASGWTERGDTFLLMSDALSVWFLGACAAGQTPCLVLQRLMNEDGCRFGEWVNELRAARLLRNDDVTVSAVSID